jgi:hypothetical protein
VEKGLGKYIVILAAALAACGAPAADKAKEAAKTAAPTDYGWMNADTAAGPAVVFREAPAAPGFTMLCDEATKALKVTVANPSDSPPMPSELGALQLGAVQFAGTAAAAQAPDGAKLLVTTIPLKPALLIALGDSKTARLTYRETPIDAGVDEDGLISAFAQRCATRTGVEPALE